MLKVTMHAMKEIGTKHHAMSLCREDLDMLVEDARSNNKTIGYALCGHMLEPKDIKKIKQNNFFGFH